MIINTIPTLKVSVADTPETQARGLMFVKSLPSDSGMLFIFGRSQKLSFWGENTLIALDIAFADEDGQIIKIDKINPMSRSSVSSGVPCKYAIEANVGFFATNGIRVGDSVVINKKLSTQVIGFVKKNSKELIQSIKRAQSFSNDITDNVKTLSDYYDSQQLDQEDQGLPVLNSDELGQYLEDSIEDQEQMQQEDGLPQEIPLSPEELEPKSVEELEKEIPSFSNVSDAFNWAQQNKQVMKITYQTTTKTKGTRMFGNNTIIRSVEPHGRFTSSPENGSSHEVLVTFDETVGGIRAFRMQNIKQFSITGKSFNPKFVVR